MAASKDFSNNGYKEVAERIPEFMAKYPEGSLQSVSIKDIEIGGKLFIEVIAQANRHPEDPRPGVGISREPFPGTTPYTKNSEAENSETSAWGRALAAIGFATKADGTPGIASANAVRNRQAEQDTPPKPLTVAQLSKVMERLVTAEQSRVDLELTAIGAGAVSELTPVQAKALLEKVGA